ncbi:MAG TPA: hypothetical protein PKW95_14465 [bacterium]|nr:hypothetical protein [bacterium]
MEWLSENWQLVSGLVVSGRVFDALTTQLGIAITIVLFIFGMIYTRHRKKLFMVLFALWGYSAVYHFTVERTEAAGEGGNLVQNVVGVGAMAEFFLGAAVVTGVLLYFGLVRE